MCLSYTIASYRAHVFQVKDTQIDLPFHHFDSTYAYAKVTDYILVTDKKQSTYSFIIFFFQSIYIKYAN
jgi:hypothetical protein